MYKRQSAYSFTAAKDLKPVDRTGFRRLSFTDGHDWAWRASGVPQ